MIEQINSINEAIMQLGEGALSNIGAVLEGIEARLARLEEITAADA